MLSLFEIIKAANGLASPNDKNVIFNSISTDSRNIREGGLFIALKGPKFDGHDYVNYAFRRGALGAVVLKGLPLAPLQEERGKKKQNSKDEALPRLNKNKIIIHVKNTLRALQDIAAFYRRKFPVKVIAVTGSSGKTTTKDMIASVLSKKAPTIKTIENLNNEIGVPLTIFQINKKHKFAVVEMGMRGRGEISRLSCIARPDIAVITNIGEAHIEKLKTKKMIAAAKGEVLEYLGKRGIAILNSDDEYFDFLKKQAKGGNIISFGLKNGADVTAESIKEFNGKTSFILASGKQRIKIDIPLPGRHNIYNALSAAAVGIALGMPLKIIREGIRAFKPSGKRMNISTTKKGIRVINDTYNANPSSMKAALSVLASQGPVTGSPQTRRIAVIGDMLELGNIAKKAHKEIGRFVSSAGIEILVAVGNLAKYYIDGAKTMKNASFYFKNNSSALKKIKKIIRPNDVILLKASRGMKLEEISKKIVDNDI